MKVLIGVLLVMFMVGCGSGKSTSGVEEDRGGGDGPRAEVENVVETQPNAPSATPDIGRALALSHTPYPGKAIRWPSRHVPITLTTPWAIKGANVWRPLGFKFTHGMGGGISFGGYSEERNSVGWAIFNFRRGAITSCKIYINPKWMKRYDIAETFAHEIGHCLGINGHIPGGLMAWNGGNGIVSQNTKSMLNYVYSRRPGARL